MLTLTGSRLLRFLLSLLIRFRLSLGRIALAFRARFTSLWRSILTFARHDRDLSYVPLHASNAPAVNSNHIQGECQQHSEPERTGEEDNGTLATQPVRKTTQWKDELPKYQALISGLQLEFHAYAATPERGSQRYKPRRVRQSNGPGNIPAGQQTLLSALPELPNSWRRHVHPEGNVFFYHEGLRIFTESNVARAEKEILFYATHLIQNAIDLNAKGVILDEFTELVLNVDEERNWHYYFVDHKNRLLFWVDSIEPREVLGTDLQGITGYSHIRYLVEARYWYASSNSLKGDIMCNTASRSHCEYYPHERTLPKGVFQDLRGMLNYAKTDMMTAGSSTSPFTQAELVAILDLVNSLKDDKTISDSYSIWVIARLMAFFTEDQFLNFCGQQCARLNADAPLFGQQIWNCSIIFQMVNMFLLKSPNEHALRLQRVWVDGTIIQPRWEDFVNRLTAELGRYPIFSTVMLAVNFSFLAVPGVTGTPAGPVQIIIYCSIVSTVASIIFSFALANLYSDPGLMAAVPVADVMRTLSRTKSGMACLAITHSLPIACLVWSMTFFSAALAIQIFAPKELAAVTALGVECFILLLFGIMSHYVMRLFSGDDVGGDVDPFEEDDPTSTKLQHDVEHGPPEK